MTHDTTATGAATLTPDPPADAEPDLPGGGRGWLLPLDASSIDRGGFGAASPTRRSTPVGLPR